jgi:hypothetical protein
MEHTYKSGEAVVEFELVKTEHGRAYFNFKVSLDGNVLSETNNADYGCPNFWTTDMVAADMFTWALDDHDNLYDVLEFDADHSREDIVLVERVIN